jgi:tetratricopeptide (TPR) repeat protein
LIGSPTPENLKEAVSLYRGELLPAFYDDWVLARRERLGEIHLTALLELAALAETGRETGKALAYYRRVLGVDPFREEAARGQMRTLGQDGRYSEALGYYKALERRLLDEIGVLPGLETRLLADRLRGERDLAQRAVALPVPAPFVGRVSERARLLARLDQARSGQGSLVVLLGEAGIGKTRLLEELAQAAGWRGWTVARGRAEEFGLQIPFTPFAQALQIALPETRMAQLERTVPAVSLSIAAALVPELALPGPVPETLKPELRVHALLRVLHGLQAIGPHLFLLDDTHWSEADLWQLLDELRDAYVEMGGLLVVSARLSEIRNRSQAWETITRWDREGVPVIRLDGLLPAEMHELFLDRSLTSGQLARLAEVSGGNPLFALQLLHEDDLELRLSQDLVLADLVLLRLAHLSAPAQYALQLASVIGIAFDYAAWEAVLTLENQPADRLPALAGEAERAGLLHLGVSGYRFAHETLRAAIYVNIPSQARPGFHRRVLDVLSVSSDARPLDLLYHAMNAGEAAAVARYALLAGETASAGLQYEAAAGYFIRALEALPPDDAAGRYRAWLGRIRAHEILAERDAQRAGLEQLQSLADILGDPDRMAEVARFKASFEWQTGNYAQARSIAELGLTLSARTQDPTAQASLLEILGRIARDLGDYPEAEERFGQALAIYEELEDSAGQASIFNNLGILAQRRGYPAQAVEMNRQAVRLYAQLGDVFGEVRALTNLGVSYWTSGDYGQAREVHERALSMNRETGDRRIEIALLSNLAALFGILGDPEQALLHYDLALDLAGPSGDKALRAGLLANRGYALYDLDRFDPALESADKALALNREIDRRRGEGYVQHTRGLILAELGRPAQAQAAFEASLAIRTGLGERDNLMDTYCSLARFHLAAGDLDRAETAHRAALGHRDPDQDSTENIRNFHFTSYLLARAHGEGDAALQHLLAAETAMLGMAGELPEPDRPRFLERLVFNRRIREALAGHSERVRARLVNAQIPLGIKLTEQDYVSVDWTLYWPGDEKILPAAARRRHVLSRLLAEAEAQGAAPTDEDLAHALGVARRTVLRDIETLLAQGVEVRTRKRSGQ